MTHCYDNQWFIILSDTAILYNFTAKKQGFKPIKKGA
jgi:hypothetical protein